MAFHVPEKYRFTEKAHPLCSDSSFGNNGAFYLPYRDPARKSIWVTTLASDGLEWEHVSVSLEKGLPTWPIMCFVKNTYWDEEDCVVQYHPPMSEYVNYHPRVLHLWRPTVAQLPQPPSLLAGPKTGEVGRELV